MAGYGGADDEAQRAQIRIDELVELAKSQLPSGPGTINCVDCGDPIPEARRKALPGVRHCVDCKSRNHDGGFTFKEPWAT